MNRVSREYVGGAKNVAVGSQHRRGRSVTGLPKDTDENLDLFSRNRRSYSVASSDESDASVKLGRISVGSVTLARSGMDNLLASVDGGKHDYDWLLTPPETPLFSSSDASESQPTTAPRKSISAFRSASATKASRFSMAQSDNSHSSRPTRSTSVTRPSISTMSYSTYSSTSNRSSSALNTSTASITSIPRPSTPAARSTSTSSTRPSTPGSRSVSSRPSTPMKCRPSPSPSPNSFSGERTRTLQNSRPSTPTSRPQIPPNLNSASGRTNSRSVTPSRRNVASGPSPVTARSASAGQVLTNGRIPAAASRGSSPSPRIHPSPQPIIPPDFPLETPPNLRTTLPDRPLSAGRSRPSSAGTVRGNADAPGVTNPSRRRSSSPIVTSGRLPEHSGKGRLFANGHDVGRTENQKTPPMSSDPASRRPSKSVTSTESTGFGRTISKKSLDMALRHMDIRNNNSASANIRSLSSITLFPQSIRSATLKRQSAHGLDSLAYVGSNVALPMVYGNSTISENGNHHTRYQDGEANEDNSHLSAKVSVDIYESSRYDAFLLREDAKNTNWLHSIDDKSDQEPLFDHRFDLLPEPF